MGLDISFNRTAAIAAGLQLTVETNGTKAEIFQAKQVNEDAEYITWLESEGEVIAIPGTELFTANDGVGDHISIRANKWGRVYEPMTNWLKANNITWGEF